jgi:hypothetical protein
MASSSYKTIEERLAIAKAKKLAWRQRNRAAVLAYSREYYHRNKDTRPKRAERYTPKPTMGGVNYIPHIVYRYHGEPGMPSQRQFTSCKACCGLPHRRPAKGKCKCGRYSHEANPYVAE